MVNSLVNALKRLEHYHFRELIHWSLILILIVCVGNYQTAKINNVPSSM